MRKLCDTICRDMQEGRDSVLLTVCERRGSAPRGAGASMLVYRDGSQVDTIGGGAVEYAAAKEAMNLFETRGSRTIVYRLNANEIAEAGMICGGTVCVLLMYLCPDEENRRLFQALTAARDTGAKAALVCRLAEGEVAETGWWDGRELHGIRADLPHTGDGAYLSEDETLLYEPVSLGARALVFGGGHVSQKLVPLLGFVDFRCVVLEDRAAFADPALFPPEAEVVLGDFSDIRRSVTVDAEDYAIVTTRGHQADYAVLRQLLRTPARYIGCIGSRHKIALTRQSLMEDGFTEADCARVHTPIGIPIGAQTPEEIAVSIAAELIACRAGAGE